MNGVRWVGTIKAFWEKWKRGDNGKAEQCGARSVSHTIFVCVGPHKVTETDSFIAVFRSGYPPPPTELSLKLSELYPLKDIDGGDTIFPLPFVEFQLALLRERKVIAKERCAAALLKVKARENDPLEIGLSIPREIHNRL